jgi:VWFA-related protein
MNREFRIHRFLALAVGLACLSFAFHVFGQVISDDEIRFFTRPYSPQPENAIRVSANLVEIPVIVRDAAGVVVKDLTKDDFEVYDRGNQQGISFFSVETAPNVNKKEAVATTAPEAVPAPAAPARKTRFIAFYFDDFNMSAGDTNASRGAAEKFIREGLEVGDKAGVFTTSTEVSQEFTDDKQKLLDALEKIRTHQKVSGGAAHCPNISPYQAFLIDQSLNSYSDALDLGIQQALQCRACTSAQAGGLATPCAPVVNSEAMQTLAVSEHFAEETLTIMNEVINYLGKMPGRRMLVLTSSGFMVQTVGPQAYQEKVIDVALRDNVVINSLDAKELWAAPPGGDPSQFMDRITTGPMAAYQDQLDDMQKSINNDTLAELAEGTGGRFIHNSNDLIGGFRELVEPPEVSYVLGFSPDNVIPDGRLHTLMVKLINHRRGQTVSARHGYYAQTKKEADDLAPAYARREKMNQAVMASDSASDITATVNVEQTKSDDGAPALKVVIHVDVKNLPFQVHKGNNQENLVFVSALFDDQNHFLNGVQGYLDLNLKDATLTQLAIKGLDADLSLQAPPGHYRLRQVVQEEATGRLAALSTPVEIRRQ